MFTENQKKWIVRLKTSEKNVGSLIGENNSESHIHGCCLGVYAMCCGLKLDGHEIIFRGGTDDSLFVDAEEYDLEDDAGLFLGLYVAADSGCVPMSLAEINDYEDHDFSHEFISKFLFTMPERVFTNFNNEGHRELRLDDFVKEVEKLAKEKEYEKITIEWEKSFQE
jgi:hypothetical protein